MFILTILKADGSHYWTEHFNSQADADAWLAEEQTRPYWDTEYTAQLVDTTPAPQPVDLMKEIRARRNALLSACDWTQLTDTPLDSGKKIAWESYRQALRDLPETTTDPCNPIWPVPPS